MAILGGSPLGLIGVLSTPNRDGMSTFNAGKTRNINVNRYNTGKSTNADIKSGMVSLFTGGNQLKAWANIGTIGTDKDKNGNESYKGFSRSTLHNNDVYDTSVLNIIEKLSNTNASLRPSDFAYLKDIGVYPNNRLMIARRFGSPMTDNIFSKGNPPMSIMMGWKPEGEDFFTISFGEVWEDSVADFTGILNSMGEDFLGQNVGSAIGGGLSAIPLPGFTEQLQRKVLEKLGVFEEGASTDPLPAGNPNLIKIAKKRKTIKYGEAGSGLKCDIQVTMTCVYEQKFISGIDPTIMWQDLLSTAFRFGTSNSFGYGMSKEFGKRVNSWARNPSQMVIDFANALKGTLDSIGGELLASIEKSFDDKISNIGKTAKSLTGAERDSAAKEKLEKEKEGATGFLSGIMSIAIDTLSATVSKYEQEIRGVVGALTGSPTTPWHITIGNPLRPIFCAGDMLTDDIKVTLGPDLAFNDLPSKITVEFTLKNARPWGLQEIAAKFNTGNLRVVNTKKDFTTLTPSQTLMNEPNEFKEKDDKIETNSSNGISNTSDVVNNKNVGVTSENSNVSIINKDAGSGYSAESIITDGTNTIKK